MNTISTIPLKDSSLSLEIDGRHIDPSGDLKVVSFSTQEGIFKVPTFSIEFSTPVNTSKFEMSEISAQLTVTTSNGGSYKVLYYGSVISMSVNVISGVLIKRDHYLKRRSQSFGSSDLDSAIKTLNVASNSNLNSRVQGNNVFYQLNETDWQCASRLLNLIGKDMLWAVADDEIKMFSAKITNTKPMSLGKYESFNMSNLMHMKNEPDSIESNNNLFFGTSNVCIPSISDYPKDCLASLMSKSRYSKWRNVSVSKTVYSRLDIRIGDSVKFDWDSESITDFILIGLDCKYTQGGNSFNYTFANYTDWNPAGA